MDFLRLIVKRLFVLVLEIQWQDRENKGIGRLLDARTTVAINV